MPCTHSMPVSPSAAATSNGGTLVSVDGRTLPLSATELSGEVRGGYGRITVCQTFQNPYDEPLRVTYQLPLPSDGAVAGFSFRIGDKLVRGEVDKKARARERFEEAIATGRTAAILDQERSSLFTQEVGNIPPGQTVVVTLHVDQRLRWIADAAATCGGWEWRFPTVVAPRYLGAAGRVADASAISVDVADGPTTPRVSLKLAIAEPIAEGTRPRSPSHTLALSHAGGAHEVELSDDGTALDRDLVVRWAVAEDDIGVALDVARPEAGHGASDHAFGLVTLVPPATTARSVSRDLIVLLDTSGSMHGEPLAQAKHVTCALIDTLGDDDTLELIEFSSAVRRWHRGAKAMKAKHKRKAIEWVHALSAGGGTEMRTGIVEALSGLRAEAQRQVVVITDGLIGFEAEIVAEVMRGRPRGCRVHTVGIGSAVNRSLTTPVARAGAGLEVICGIGEDPERAARRLCARTAAPVVVDVRLEGDALVEHAPVHIPDLFAGAPALLGVKLRPDGGTLRITGRTDHGAWSTELHVPKAACGDGRASLASLYGREQVEDLELQRAAGERGVDPTIEALGLQYQIATRLTSWLAITEEAMVDPRDPSRRETMSQALPHGMSVEGLGLRAASMSMPLGAPPMQGMAPPAAMAPPAPPAPRRRMAAFGGVQKKGKAKLDMAPGSAGGRGAPMPPPPPGDDAGDDLSGMLADEEVAELREDTGAMFLDAIASEGAAAPEEAERAKEEAPSMTRAGATKGRLWSGKVVSWRDGRLIVEVTLSAEDTWTQQGQVTISLSDGSTLVATWIAEQTTRPGRHPAGTVLRLALSLAMPLSGNEGEPVLVTIGDTLVTLNR